MPRRRTPLRVRGVAPTPVDAASGVTPPPDRAATAHRDVAAAGAKQMRLWWPDICDRFWKVLGCGLGRKRRSSGGVVDSLRQNDNRDTVVVNLGDDGDVINLSTTRGVGVGVNPPTERQSDRQQNQSFDDRETERSPKPLEVNGSTVSR